MSFGTVLATVALVLVAARSPARVRRCARERVGVGLVWAMGVALVGYSGGLALNLQMADPRHDYWFRLVVDNWLGQAAVWLPAAVCWLAVSRVRRGRAALLLAALAVTSYALGNTYYLAALGADTAVPFPSLGDVGYLGFPVFMVVALAVVMRHRLRGAALSVWLDGAVGSLGAAAVLAVLLHPVVDSALTEPLSLATVVALAYPMLDLILVAVIVGVAALAGGWAGQRWNVLIVGLLVYATGDVVYALQVTADIYVVGTPLDATWPVGLALVALWVDGNARTTSVQAHPRTNAAAGSTALVIAAMSTLAALGVLIWGTRAPLSTLAAVLATATLVAVAARTQIAFGQMVRMADLRRQATTDDLTCLANRRALYTDGEALLIKTPNQPRALLLLDLDRFKEVNDSLGHHAGDQLLIEVGLRLREQLRDGDLLARLGGDEFAVLLADGVRAGATAVAVKLHQVLADPLTIEGLALHSSVSIGIAVFPDDGPDLFTLLRKADIAMYQAKASGDGHHAYDSADDSDGVTRLRVMEELRTAMATDQLVLHYPAESQPGHRRGTQRGGPGALGPPHPGPALP